MLFKYASTASSVDSGMSAFSLWSKPSVITNRDVFSLDLEFLTFPSKLPTPFPFILPMPPFIEISLFEAADQDSEPFATFFVTVMYAPQ